MPAKSKCGYFEVQLWIHIITAGGIPESGVLVEEEHAVWHPLQGSVSHESEDGPILGQVAGVAKGLNGTVWVFHRAERVWEGSSFSGPNLEHVTHKEPIKGSTVYQLDQDTGTRAFPCVFKKIQNPTQLRLVLAEVSQEAKLLLTSKTAPLRPLLPQDGSCFE